MKKFVAALLALTALLAVAGCSGRPATMADMPDQEVPDPDPIPVYDGEGTIRTGLYAVGSLGSSTNAG